MHTRYLSVQNLQGKPNADCMTDFFCCWMHAVTIWEIAILKHKSCSRYHYITQNVAHRNVPKAVPKQTLHKHVLNVSTILLNDEIKAAAPLVDTLPLALPKCNAMTTWTVKIVCKQYNNDITFGDVTPFKTKSNKRLRCCYVVNFALINSGYASSNRHNFGSAQQKFTKFWTLIANWILK